jgi:hypothetical protein
MAQIKFEFTEEKVRQLDDVQKRAGLATRKDLVNDALTLYTRLLQLIEQGGSLPWVEINGIHKELAIPSLLEVFERVQRDLKPKTGT